MSAYSNFVCLFVWMLLLIRVQNQTLPTTPDSMPRSVYTFGDSFVDPGNNNYLDKVAKSNFPPYGMDFVNHEATGRFSNGRLFPDFLASHFGATYQRPYLDPSFDLHQTEALTAISFASATTGFDPATSNLSNAIPMLKQLEYFKEYKAKLEKAKGKNQSDEQIRNAIFYLNAGSDDFAFTLFGDGDNQSRKTIDPEAYEDLIVNLTMQFLQGLSDQGARRIAVNGLPPLGCIPVAITMIPPKSPGRDCLKMVNKISKDFNKKLQKELKRMKGIHTTYIDFETPLRDLIRNPDQYGYKDVNKGCCGNGGLYQIGRNCNQKIQLCNNTSEFVFWDAAHPTEKTYSLIFSSNLHHIDRLTKK